VSPSDNVARRHGGNVDDTGFLQFPLVAWSEEEPMAKPVGSERETMNRL
jgi:hypothetical protein